MKKSRFFFMEPSKVSTQHITMIEGFLEALTSSEAVAGSHDVIVCASQSTFDSLKAGLRSRVKYRAIPVMNPEKRRLVVKALLEFAVVLRYVLGMRRGDILFVTCLMSPALLLLEVLNKVLRRDGIFIVLHGDLEGLFDTQRQGIGSFGYWMLKWMRARQPDSRVALVVIDDFIKDKLLNEFSSKLSQDQIFVFHHPVSPLVMDELAQASKPAVCFIGYRTAMKGFDSFKAVSDATPSVDFLAIGGGKIENVSRASVAPIQTNDEYLRAIAGCTVAVFPYKGGYSCSLSAAALDALSGGVHIIATPRGCFLSLRDNLGPEAVTICATLEDISKLLTDSAWLASVRAGQQSRLKMLAGSKYGIASLRSSFERLISAGAPLMREAA